jgi:hypothetical protein
LDLRLTEFTMTFGNYSFQPPTADRKHNVFLELKWNYSTQSGNTSAVIGSF